MNKIVYIAAVMAAATTLAETTKNLSLDPGGSGTVELTFIPKSYRFNGSEIVSVSLTGSRTVNVKSLGTPGNTEIQFNNAAGGEGAILKVNVSTAMEKLARQLEDDWLLTEFPGIECLSSANGIILKGSLSSPAKFERLIKICSLPDFKDKVNYSLVGLRLDPKALNKLRKDFEEEGVKLAAEGKPEIGELALSYGDEAGLSLVGTFYSESDRQKVLSVLQRQSWIGDMVATNMLSGNNISIKSAIPIKGSLSVDDALLELGVAFLKISKNRSREVGAFDQEGNPIQGLSLRAVWGGLFKFINGESHTHGRSFIVGADFDQTISMLGGNGVTRDKRQGTLRIHANGDPGKTYLLGGTVTVTPPQKGRGEAPAAQEFEYGFKIVNKSTRRVSKKEVEVDVDISLNGFSFEKNKYVPGSQVVNKTENKVSPTVRVPLGQTVAIAGYESLYEETSNNGTPVLRHIPILNWFSGGEKDDRTDDALLFLVSVREVDAEGEAPMVPNSPMKDITYDANRPNAERIQEEKEELKKKRHGCTPLTWFRW